MSHPTGQWHSRAQDWRPRGVALHPRGVHGIAWWLKTKWLVQQDPQSLPIAPLGFSSPAGTGHQQKVS